MFEDLFFERLPKLRMKQGVSARDMSLSLGQSAGYINKIENRRALPSLNGFFYICEYFGISPKEFFGEENSNPFALNEIISHMKKLDANQLDKLLEFIKSVDPKK